MLFATVILPSFGENLSRDSP